MIEAGMRQSSAARGVVEETATLEQKLNRPIPQKSWFDVPTQNHVAQA